MQCPDCKGGKVYQPFFGPKEACRNCSGTGEVAVPEENGVIYFSVTSDGTTGPEWIERLERKGFRVDGSDKSVLRSSDFKPSSSGEPIQIVVLKGELFEDSDRTTKRVRAEASRRNLTEPMPRWLALSGRSSRIRRSRLWASGESSPCTSPSWILMALRACLVRTASATYPGWTHTATGLASDGVATTGSPSSSRKSVLKIKAL